MFHNVELLVFLICLAYVLASFFRWIIKLCGHGYPYYINLTYTKNGIKHTERFYVVDNEHFFEIVTNLEMDDR